MRIHKLQVFLLIIFITACGSQPSSPSPNIGLHPTSTRVFQPVPTKFALGACTDARKPTPKPNEVSLFAPVSNQDHISGDTNAAVTILVYSDFQCAACAKLAPLLQSFIEKYPQDVRVVFRHFPLESIHDKAALAAQAAEAAGLQGKFWEMHTLLFSRQDEWTKQTPDQFKQWLETNSSTINLDASRFGKDLASPAVTQIIEKAWTDGQKINLPGAPVILINGEIIKWQTSLFDQLEGFVRLAKLQKEQYDRCPPLEISPEKKYTAILQTSRGEVKINLFADRAPITVNNFVFLARQGWYKNNPFYRVVPGLIVQSGDPTGTGLGNPGYFFANEKGADLPFDRAGLIGMANSAPDTNGSQFFVTLSSASQLDGKFPVFGEVISGLDILASFGAVDPSTTAATPPAMLLNVIIEEK